MWKCALYSSRYSGDNNRQDDIKTFFRTKRLRDKERERERERER